MDGFELAARLTALFERKIEDEERLLGEGVADDYAGYRHRVGRISAFRDALAELSEQKREVNNAIAELMR